MADRATRSPPARPGTTLSGLARRHPERFEELAEELNWQIYEEIQALSGDEEQAQGLSGDRDGSPLRIVPPPAD